MERSKIRYLLSDQQVLDETLEFRKIKKIIVNYLVCLIKPK